MYAYKSALSTGPCLSAVSALLGKKRAFGAQPSHLCVPFGVQLRDLSHTWKVTKASPGC